MSDQLQISPQWTKIVHNMSTIQLKVTLPRELHQILKNKADKFGLTLSSYVKNLIIDDVKPKTSWNPKEFVLTDKQIAKSYKEAIENPDDRIEIDDIDEFFDNL